MYYELLQRSKLTIDGKPIELLFMKIGKHKVCVYVEGVEW